MGISWLDEYILVLQSTIGVLDVFIPRRVKYLHAGIVI